MLSCSVASQQMGLLRRCLEAAAARRAGGVGGCLYPQGAQCYLAPQSLGVRGGLCGSTWVVLPSAEGQCGTQEARWALTVSQSEGKCVVLLRRRGSGLCPVSLHVLA